MKLPRYDSPWGIFIYGAAIVLILWLGYQRLPVGINSAEEGQFGDKFGALNTLFTGIALVGLLATLKHQRDERTSAERDHTNLINAHTANTQALNGLREAQRQANYITLLGARIEGYSHQQKIYSQSNGKIPPKLVDEQDALLWELGTALTNARKDAHAEGNIHRPKA